MERDLSSVTDRGLLAIGRGVLKLVEEHPGVQLVQVEALKGEVIDQAERLENYGFGGHPLAGAEAVVNAVGGSRNHPLIVVVADRRYRPALEPGEVIIYDDQGQIVHIHRDGITIHTDKDVRIEGARVEVVATESASIEAPTVEVRAASTLDLIAPKIKLQSSAGIDLVGGPYVHSTPPVTQPS